jgi:hypothetical protein
MGVRAAVGNGNIVVDGDWGFGGRVGGNGGGWGGMNTANK